MPYGRYFDEFEVGQVFKKNTGRAGPFPKLTTHGFRF